MRGKKNILYSFNEASGKHDEVATKQVRGLSACRAPCDFSRVKRRFAFLVPVGHRGTAHFHRAVRLLEKIRRFRKHNATSKLSRTCCLR